MSAHLPECHFAQPGTSLSPCICSRLRACEQRVLLSKPNIELSAVYGYEAGRSEGLSAARDAVAALPVVLVDIRRDAFDEQQYRQAVVLDDALAAIDALRGDA